MALPFLFPALGGSLFGYDIGAASGASVPISSPVLSGTDWYNLTSLQQGLIVSGSLYGAILGSIPAFKFADFLGRRRELMTAAIFYIVGALISALAPIFRFDFWNRDWSCDARGADVHCGDFPE